MKNVTAQSTRHCGCCKQEFSIDFFYPTRGGKGRDSYCKACRRAVSREGREQEKRSHFENRKRKRLVLTDIADKEQRHKLILRALKLVRESMERKRKRGF